MGGAEFDKAYARLARLLSGNYNTARATVIRESVLGCPDEGIEYARYRLAGGGCLYGLKETAMLVRKLGVDVGEHPDCGAVRVYLQRVKGIKAPTMKQVDDAAVEWSRTVAAMAGQKVVSMELHRPAHHDAVCLYYDGTGKMTSCEGLPRGFIVSRSILPRDYATREVVTLAEIAFAHGFNDYFTHEQPFYLVGVGKDENHSRELQEELAEHAVPQLMISEQARTKTARIHLRAA